MNKSIRLFNNEIEMGVKILVILRCIYPRSIDTEMINYYSYFSLHSGDIGDKKSLHPDVPNRFGELSIKMDLIHRSIRMLLSKELVKQKHTKYGFEYEATEMTAPFLDSLNEAYLVTLTSKVKWVSESFIGSYSAKEIRLFVNENKDKWGGELSYCTKGLLNE